MSAASRRLWLNEAGDVVEDGDPSARFLLAGEGCEIPEGYSEPSAPKHTPKAVDPDLEPESKSSRRKS